MECSPEHRYPSSQSTKYVNLMMTKKYSNLHSKKVKIKND
jgi:hypothetical protein